MGRAAARGLGNRSADEVTVYVDERPVVGVVGRSLAATLHVAELHQLGRNLVSGEPRGPFCGMGVCFECEVTINGRPGVRACQVEVCDGMRVVTTREAPSRA